MPTYVYKCSDCDYVFEVRQRMADEPLTECPECRNEGLRRVINSVGIVFKGKGFYVTDNRNGRTSSVGSNGKEADSTTTESSSEAKSEKSETKSTEKAGEKSDT